MSVRGALRKERAYREQHAVSQMQRLIRICSPGTFRSRSIKREKPHFPNKRTGWLPRRRGRIVPIADIRRTSLPTESKQRNHQA